MERPFSRDYAEAREKFRVAAAAAGAEIQAYRLDRPGPDDLDLTADTAWIGPRGARAVLVCPSDWSAATQKETWQRLQGWIGRHGLAAFQKAVSGGQWTHASGLFYGGRSASWSRNTLTSIVTAELARATRVCLLDFHTGLGPYGYAEPIIGQRRTDPAFMRARSWIGGGAKSLYGDGSVSAEIKGDGLTALPALLPHAAVDAVALECGIRPMLEVANALRADAWLHAHGDPLCATAKPIKHMIREAFYSDDPFWQGMALGQGIAACRAAIGGLAAG